MDFKHISVLKEESINFPSVHSLASKLNWNDAETVYINGVPVAKEERSEIKYTDAIALIISIMNSMINIVTIGA